MKCIGIHKTNIIHFERCIHCPKHGELIEFETLADAVKRGYKLAKCCKAIRDRMFEKGFVIKGPKADIEFLSKKHYYPEDVITS